jgi:hypothetical protein
LSKPIWMVDYSSLSSSTIILRRSTQASMIPPTHFCFHIAILKIHEKWIYHIWIYIIEYVMICTNKMGVFSHLSMDFKWSNLSNS